jgi:threonine/homoserine/homoserine lactone efflux protein
MLFEFMAASLVLIAIPGPDQALITRNALLRGRTAALRTMLGGATGLSVHATAAAFGISALLASSAAAYTTLKLVGIAYLLYLGIRMLLTSGRHDDQDSGGSHGRPFAQGLLSNALNPKIAIFFLTFLPQFLPDHGATLPTALVLSAVFAALYLAWFSGLISLVDLVGNALRKPSVKARMDRITASALIAFGVRLAAQGKH